MDISFTRAQLAVADAACRCAQQERQPPAYRASAAAACIEG